MNFKPKTEKQIAEERLKPAGVYPFEVINAESRQSKAGNDMIALEVRLFTPDDRSFTLDDYLMEKVAYKLFHFCAYTGLSQQYKDGTLAAEDCVGRTGFAKVAIKSDKTGQYPDQNQITDYVRQEIKREGGVVTRPEPTADQLANRTGGNVDEDVPF